MSKPRSLFQFFYLDSSGKEIFILSCGQSRSAILDTIVFILWGNSDYVPSVRSIGFYCNDTTIQMPYNGDSVHISILFLTLLGGGALIIYVSEILAISNPNNFEFKYHLKKYYSGFVYILVVTEFLKLTFCELRPHFWSTCQPDIDQTKCSSGLVTDFICTGDGPRWLVERDIYKSFPSGHAALSFYTFVFLSMHALSRLGSIQHRFCTLWKQLIPIVCLAWTVTCCISRLVDHRHFWWDVAFGVVIGLVGGLVMVNITRNRRNQLKLSS